MEKINIIDISEELEKETLEKIEGMIGFSYEDFIKTFKDGGYGLGNSFFLLGILKSRGNKKALELHKILSEGHWKTRKLEIQKQNEALKIIEMGKNKQEFIIKMKQSVGEEEGKLKILREYETEYGKMVVVGLILNDNQSFALVAGGTTAIYENETPGLFDEVNTKYIRFNGEYN